MLDLSFGLPIVIRDAALKMIAPGPTSDINREFYAQEHEKEIEEGRGAVEAYNKTDEKARDLLRRLAQSEPYYKKQRRLELEAEERDNNGENSGSTEASSIVAVSRSSYNQSGPIRTSDSTQRGVMSSKAYASNNRKSKASSSNVAAQPPQPEDILPPADRNVTSLFVTGIEDDFPEHLLRTHFEQFGRLRSLVCSHRSHCAFVNYMTREAAETAAQACQGRAIIKGVPLRVQWGKPKPLDSLDRDERLKNARSGRSAVGNTSSKSLLTSDGGRGSVMTNDISIDQDVIAPPPGADDEIQYASLAGE